MNWETYSKRRRMDLGAFLNDSATESEALQKFARKGIDVFPREEVSKYYEDLQAANAQTKEPEAVAPAQEEVAVDSTTAPKSTKVKSGTEPV